MLNANGGKVPEKQRDLADNMKKNLLNPMVVHRRFTKSRSVTTVFFYILN
jgi:hypothetical protein